MAPNIPQSGTAGRDVWYTEATTVPLLTVSDPGGWNDAEADPRLYRRTGAVRAAAGGARPRGDRGQRSDDHRPGDRHELLHDERRVRDRAQGVRAGVREGGRAAGRLVERRHDLRRGQLQARRPAEREARAVHRGQSEGDGDSSHGERSPHDRDQDGLGRDLMRRTLGAAVLSAALVACGSPAPRGFTLLFLRRSPAAFAGGLSWAPDPEQSRLIAFDRRLQVAKRVTSPRLAMPMAVAALGDARLLIAERTGEGVVFDTAGRPVREWDSPDVASLYAAGGGRGGGQRIVAVRSPYYVPQLGAAEPDTAPLVRVLDTLGRPVEGLATIRVPQAPFLTYLVNAGAVAAGPDGSVYYAPRVRDALVNLALALGPDGRLYALGSDDSAASRLRVDVLDTATGAILATHHLGPRETAVAVRGGTLATFDADSLLIGAVASAREPFAPPFALAALDGDTVTPARFAGKVTLVNFWASWCDPCREEFPHMAQLYREFDRTDFEIAAISDDVDRGKMVAFVRQFRPPFPVLEGGGRMKQMYHYRGLPYSVLLDRHGRIVERLFGFGGVDEFRKLHETIAKEVQAP